ncbi:MULTISPECIES: hypothetical protein [unclassified Duganella]|uniref:hypothetical protein n=1 Tax=unclassified Duganella TaxID=2636909 RepID=UPI00087FCEA1|nr:MULTISPECIES: hypothetical protein [unclassified Duganella]SDG84950.1 hypothetical protein SAMN05216320_107284 [Duganella sp. OV458]SDK12359.1 hypothetical protein SAMN05428973_108285 [Duganella sp. OV510]
MSTGPAIPFLVVVPGGSHDFSSIYAIASAYAQSGELLNNRAAETNRLEFAFPAMVCSSFAIELFLKFFLTLSNAENPTAPQVKRNGHPLQNLWERIKPEHQDLIVSMFRNPSHVPISVGLDVRKTQFLDALKHIGPAPFVDWRYAYEIDTPKLMSHGAITEVQDAVGYAARHIMEKRRAGSPSSGEPLS